MRSFFSSIFEEGLTIGKLLLTLTKKKKSYTDQMVSEWRDRYKLPKQILPSEKHKTGNIMFHIIDLSVISITLIIANHSIGSHINSNLIQLPPLTCVSRPQGNDKGTKHFNRVKRKSIRM